jgi:ectoine hydroxylase-related dioxygenase (phytanoyl-CoA dioxygenase family)
MTIEHLGPDAGTDSIAAALERDGAAIIDNLVDAAVLDKIHAELAPHIEATAGGVDDFSGRNTRRTGALIARSETCRELIMHPLVRDTVARVLSHATSYQLHLTQVITIGPGSQSQLIHRDQWAFDFFPFPKGYEVQCNTIWAMSDFTEENGATRLVPGSTRFDDGLEFEQSDTVPAEMTKGSVLLYTGSVYHGGGANRSDETRYGINVTYNVSWLRQEENQYLSVPLEIARTLPEELLRLMGYARGAYALGYIDDLRDPIAVVRPELATTGLGDLEIAELQAGFPKRDKG